MPFVPAQIEIKPAHIGTGIKASLRAGKKSNAKLSLFISLRVAELYGWKEGDGVEVLLGDGPEHGLIRIRAHKSNAQAKFNKKGTGKAEFLILQLGHQAAFVDRNETGQWCKWEEVDSGWIEIVLPKWADETSPNRKVAAVAAHATQVTHERVGTAKPEDRYKSPAVEAARAEKRGPGRPPVRQNVTAALMGDPPPNRREMLEKIGQMKP